MFDAAMKNDPRFREYQERQGKEQIITQFRAAKHLAGFVVEPTTKQTIFMGVWDQLGERTPTIDPFTMKPPNTTTVAFTTQLRAAFDDYRGRVVIDWGDGERAWVQRADNQDKPILEIRQRREDPAFPGFARLRLPLCDVENVPFAWAEVLRNARGIYLLVHRQSGQQYVGSAYGEGGFFARWTCYADGHGGNVAMKQLGAPASDYDATILDVMGSDATADDVFARESLWKDKLGTRVKGLNRN
ncbi:MAG: GIY-YIG nuclease family protein [Sandaracinaceae bacterium]|nr:GIY-YIG nuclease family protein [Sandaracinaceae bacterium]